MTTKNFLLFQAGKQGGVSGRTIPEELFKPENFGKVITLRGADDVPYLGAEDLPKLFIADFGRTPFLDVKNAYDGGAVVVCYHNDALYQLSSFNGFKIEFARTLENADGKIFYATTTVTEGGWASSDTELATEDYVTDELSKLDIPKISVVGKNRENQKGVVWYGSSAGRLLPEDLFTAENDGKVFVIRNYAGAFYLVAEELLPEIKSTDAGKVLKVDTDGAPKWKDESKATFTAIYSTTPFADIEQAIADGYCVKCDASGYTYELVQALSDKITFALTNNVNGSIAQETVWVTSDNEWDGEAVNLANASDVTTALNAKADKTYVDDMLGNVEALLAAL